MTKIEYMEDENSDLLTGWYINEYDKDHLVDSTGPYDTKTAALRMWRDEKPNSRKLADAKDDNQKI